MLAKDLIKEIKAAVKEEKKFTAIILKHLINIEKRKIYLDHDCPSLYKFCIKILGYSDAEAAVRVKAARLLRATPTVEKEIQQGTLNLSNASKLQTFFLENPKLKEDKKTEIIEKVLTKTCRQTEIILAAANKAIDPTRPEKPISKTIRLNNSILKKMEKLSRQLGGNFSELELIQILLDEKLKKVAAAKPRRCERGSKVQRYIPRTIKEALDLRADGRCEHHEFLTGRRCSARNYLVYDHIQPVRAGGASTVTNLRVICQAHNTARELGFGGDKSVERGMGKICRVCSLDDIKFGAKKRFCCEGDGITEGKIFREKSDR